MVAKIGTLISRRIALAALCALALMCCSRGAWKRDSSASSASVVAATSRSPSALIGAPTPLRTSQDARIESALPDTPSAPIVLPTGTTVVWTRPKVAGNDRAISAHSRFTYGSYRRSGFGGRAIPATTYFLDRSGTLIARRSGIFIAVEDRLYRFAIEKRHTPYECDGHVAGTREHDRAVLVPVRGGRPIELAPFSDPGASDFETHTLLGSLGPYFFIKTDETEGALGTFPGCAGVHPMYGAAFKAVEIRASLVHDVPLEAITDGAAALRTAAQKVLDAELIGLGAAAPCSSSPEACASGLELTMALPSFGLHGLGWDAQLSTDDATWSDSDGTWGGYKRSAVLPLLEVPPRFRSLAPLADLVTTFVAAHPREWVLGVSHGEVVPPR